MALNSGANSGTMEISHNNLFDAVNWDDTTPSNTFHHNGIFVFQGSGGAQSGAVNIFDNWIHGDWGTRQTGYIFIDPNGGTVSNVRMFNNLLVNGSSTNGPGNGYITGCGTNTAPFGQIYNNTIFGNGVGQSGIKTDSPCVIRNNIISTVPIGIFVNPGTTLSDSNFNVLFGLTAINVMFSGAGAGGTGYPTVAAWTTGTGFDGASSIGNPNLNSGSSPPFQPQAGSSAILLGTNLTSLGITALNSDYLGINRPASGNWTSGAYQFGGVTPPSAPTGLTGSVTGSTANLSWTASTGSPVPTAYTLYRGTVHGGPYSVVKSGLTSTSTTDTPANGTYFYTVTAYVGGVISTISGNGATATVTCNSTCPSFPTGTALTIAADSVSQFNGTFTSTGQPTNSTFTFASSTVGSGTGGGAWPTTQESAKSNEIQLTVPAALTATFLPASRTFASQTVGTSSASQSFTFTNTSGAGGTVTNSSKILSGANAGDFSFTDNCPSLMLSGTNCTFNVTFTPTAGGARTAILEVFNNANASPYTVTVNGTGVAATPIVSLSPTSLNFGDQTLSTTSTVRSIILTNTGSGTLTVTSVVASGDFAVVTVPVTNCGGSVASLGTCSLNVTFTPTATGGRSGTITVTDNAAGSPHIATVQGVGITTKCQMTGNVTLSGTSGVCQ
jgi:hypothetical protein